MPRALFSSWHSGPAVLPMKTRVPVGLSEEAVGEAEEGGLVLDELAARPAACELEAHAGAWRALDDLADVLGRLAPHLP